MRMTVAQSVLPPPPRHRAVRAVAKSWPRVPSTVRCPPHPHTSSLPVGGRRCEVGRMDTPVRRSAWCCGQVATAQRRCPRHHAAPCHAYRYTAYHLTLRLHAHVSTCRAHGPAGLTLRLHHRGRLGLRSRKSARGWSSSDSSAGLMGMCLKAGTGRLRRWWTWHTPQVSTPAG
jgi:hypothetical protein